MDPQDPEEPTPLYPQPPQTHQTPPPPPGSTAVPPYPYPDPGPHQAGGYPPLQAKTNVLAILSLIFAFFFPLLGLIFGIIASSQIKKTGEQGKGLAIAGTIVSAVFLVLTVLWFLFIILLVIINPDGSTAPTY